jgi:hypothetical protein
METILINCKKDVAIISIEHHFVTETFAIKSYQENIEHKICSDILQISTQLELLINTFNSEIVTSILLLVPENLSCEDVISKPVINNIPAGLNYYKGEDDIEKLSRDLLIRKPFIQGTNAVLAMWKTLYLELGSKMYLAMNKGLKNSNRKVAKWFSDEISRDDLITKLHETHINLLIYLGHGRSRGWSGYRGLRWHHIATTTKDKPIDAIISMTCDNLKFENNVLPFGVNYVYHRKANAFLGAVSSVKIVPMKKICSIIETLVTNSDYETIGQFITKLDKHIKVINNKDLSLCWSKFRLIGNPQTLI